MNIQRIVLIVSATKIRIKEEIATLLQNQFGGRRAGENTPLAMTLFIKMSDLLFEGQRC
jgi:hypothetical protein